MRDTKEDARWASSYLGIVNGLKEAEAASFINGREVIKLLQKTHFFVVFRSAWVKRD